MKTLRFGKLLDQESISINSDFQLFGGQSEDYDYEEMDLDIEDSDSGSSWSWIISICCVLLILSLVGGLVYYFMNKKSDDKSNDNTNNNNNSSVSNTTEANVTTEQTADIKIENVLAKNIDIPAGQGNKANLSKFKFNLLNNPQEISMDVTGGADYYITLYKEDPGQSEEYTNFDYLIVLGGWNNTKSELQKNNDRSTAVQKKEMDAVLKESNSIKIKLQENNLLVTLNGETHLSDTDDGYSKVKFISLASHTPGYKVNTLMTTQL